jgi:hypothetical protein
LPSIARRFDMVAFVVTSITAGLSQAIDSSRAERARSLERLSRHA